MEGELWEIYIDYLTECGTWEWAKIDTLCKACRTL